MFSANQSNQKGMEGAFLTTIILSFISMYNTVTDTSGDLFFALRKAQAPEIKGIYWTANTAGSKARREELIGLARNTELNAVVIDVKDSTGKVFFDSKVPLAKMIHSENTRYVPDFPDLLKRLREEKIYSIARIAVFQDPYLAEQMPEIALKKADGNLWRDRKGLAWVAPSSLWVWQYNIDIAKAAVKMGFDEVNFDYIRFPSDGDISDIKYRFDEKKIPKNEVIKNFFTFIGKNFEWHEANTSVDLFGMTLWRGDGLGIGQRYQDALDSIDFISPMVYPSHYYANFEGYANPADHPYEIVYKSLIKAEENFKNSRAVLRPWLQDFDLGAVYDSDKVRKQIRASKDSHARGWMLWNASNVYTKGALSAK